MNINFLNEDVNRLIVSHLDKDSVSALSKVNQNWSNIANSSKVFYEGPANSTIFSITSFVSFGPRLMSHVNHLELVVYYEYSNTLLNEDMLLQALQALGLSAKKKYSLSLRICETVYSSHKIRSFLQTLTYKHINYVGKSFYELAKSNLEMVDSIIEKPFSVKHLQCECNFFLWSDFNELENLELSLDIIRPMQPQESEAILKAFQQTNLKKLTTLGPFLTPAVIKRLPLNLSLESLSLSGYSNSYFDWSSASLLQSLCPNIKHFSIQFSNLITRDIDFFNWSKWNLESLDLSFNYTLKNVREWPRGLKKLTVNDTSLELTSSCLDTSQLKHLSVDLSATSEWAYFLSSIITLEQLNLNMLHFLSGSQFYSATKLIGGPWFWTKLKDLNCLVYVRLKEVFFRENILESHGSFLRAWIDQCLTSVLDARLGQKYVMQTWKDLNVPEAWLESTLSLQQSLLDSDWKYIFITDSELFVFVHQKFPHLLKSMAALPYGVQRADVLRYLWLYVYGGIYIDMDYKIQKSFIKYIEDLQVPLCVLHSANVSLCITNSFIVAKPGLKFFYDLACRALGEPFGSWWAFSKHIEIMTSSGPLAFHSAVTQSGISYVVLPNELFLPSSPEIDEPVKENVRAFMIPVKGASWNSIDSQILNAVNMNKKTLLLWIGLIILFKVLDYWHLWRLRESLKRVNFLSTLL